MLILTRKIGETIIIGDNIRVVVLEARGRQIRLGIEAPADVVVLREEIARRLIDENLRAANFNYPEVQQAVRAIEVENTYGIALRPPRADSPAITIDSKALGRVTVTDDQVITFPVGVPGFPEAHRYALLNDHLKAPFYCLQSLDNPALAFVVANPAALTPDYRLHNGAAAMQELQAQHPKDVQVLVTLTVPCGRPGEMTANLMSPILINLAQGLGKQVIIEKPHYSHQHPVISLRPGCQPKPNKTQE